MIVGLDSATPPTATQAAAAKTAGVAVWSGYLATRPELGIGPGGSRFGLFRPWRQVEFAPVKMLRGTPLAYASGWDDPARCRALATTWGVRLCLDVEAGIRGDGPWVQGWLDASGAGLYGTQAVHANRRAAFHVAAWYLQQKDPASGHLVAVDPSTSWPASWPRPATLCGWQWQNTHTEFGVGVDRCWLDDGFASVVDDMTKQEHDWLASIVMALGLGTTDSTKWPNYLGWSQDVTKRLASIAAAPPGTLTAEQTQALEQIRDILIRVFK